MKQELLSRAECTAMRGIAILAIVLHNYCHFIGKIVKENEYQFFTSNNDRLWHALTNPDELLPVHLLSYFGHYGVPVFLFLSGFGLVKKYEQESRGQVHDRFGEANQATCPLDSFVRYNYLKLLRMLIVGFSLFIIVDMLTPGRFQFHWYNVVAQLAMYINVLPEPDRIIWPGIYWFFGLMIQLYIIYRLLLYRRNSWWVVGLIAVCWLLQAFCDPEGETLNRLRYNSIGGMLPFGLGIIVARIPNVGIFHSQRGNISFPTWEYLAALLVSSVLIVAMCFWYQTWFWIPALIIIGTIALVKIMPKWMLSVITWIGSISAAMFVAHPIARKLFITVAWKQDIYDGLMLYVIATIALSWAVKQIIDRIPSPKL
jgi:peptidoglycan/LPS O-acetylase OafA/YrhL